MSSGISLPSMSCTVLLKDSLFEKLTRYLICDLSKCLYGKEEDDVL
jgi:hypothetical protein